MEKENTINFTKEDLHRLPAPKDGQRVIYHDSKTHGLQLRITSKGVKTFSMFRWARAEGRPERMTVGRFPDMSVENARKKAADALDCSQTHAAIVLLGCSK